MGAPLSTADAITAPLWFIKTGTEADVRRALGIAESLAADSDPRVRSAVATYRSHAAKRLGGAQR